MESEKLMKIEKIKELHELYHKNEGLISGKGHECYICNLLAEIDKLSDVLGKSLMPYDDSLDFDDKLIRENERIKKAISSDFIARILQSYSIATGDSPIKDTLKASDFLANRLAEDVKEKLIEKEGK